MSVLKTAGPGTLPATGRTDAPPPQPGPAPTPAPTRVPLVERIIIYLALLVVIGAILFGLYELVRQSASMYGFGIEIARDAAKSGVGKPSPMVRRIFLVATAHQLVSFKAMAFGISAVIAVLGALFVLTGVQASYRLGGQSQDLKGSLQTSSPGLVLVTLGCALAAWTLSSKSSLRDPPDAQTVLAKTVDSRMQDHLRAFDRLSRRKTPTKASAKPNPPAKEAKP